MFFQFLIGISLAVLVLGIWRIFWKYILKVQCLVFKVVFRCACLKDVNLA